MKIKTNKFVAVLCIVAMIVSTIVPMFAFTAIAADVSATLSFSSTANRTSFSTSQQVWEQNDITLTNDKGSSTSNVADYANPARFYKSSKITVEAPGAITQIVFDCGSSSYATALKNSISASTATATVSSDKVTVVPTAAATSFVIASLSGGQVRMDSMTVTYAVESSCAHENTTVTETPANCVAEGSKVTTCNDCGLTLATETLPVAHKYVDGICSVCNVVAVPEADTPYVFGMVQKNKNNTAYFITGSMDGYYMATTTDAAKAAPTFLETTEGGYHMYAMVNGVKKYINMVVSGTYVNGAFGATASTVYTFSETHHTLVATVNGSEYEFGTRNDKTYTTAGPVLTANNAFNCEFYSHDHTYTEGICNCGKMEHLLTVGENADYATVGEALAACTNPDWFYHIQVLGNTTETTSNISVSANVVIFSDATGDARPTITAPAIAKGAASACTSWIVANGVTVTVRNLKITNVSTASDYTGLLSTTAGGSLIVDNTALDFAYTGAGYSAPIILDSKDYGNVSVINGSSLTNPKGRGIYFASLMAQTYNLTVSDSTIDTKGTAIQGSGAVADSVVNATITNATIKSGATTGTYLRPYKLTLNMTGSSIYSTGNGPAIDTRQKDATSMVLNITNSTIGEAGKGGNGLFISCKDTTVNLNNVTFNTDGYDVKNDTGKAAADTAKINLTNCHNVVVDGATYGTITNCTGVQFANLVKAGAGQVLAGTTAESESTSVRLVLTLTAQEAELANFTNIGVYVSRSADAVANGVKNTTDRVYTSVNAGATVVEAADGTYFVLVEIQNIPNANFGETIYVRPFVTISGSEVLGAEASFTVNGLIG